MNALGKYLLGGKPQAVAITGLLTLLSLLLPPFSYLVSGTPIGLIALRKEPAWSMQVILAALLLVTMFAQLAGIGFMFGPAIALGIWAPVWVCAQVLRNTESQGAMLLAVAATGVVVVLGGQLFQNELTSVWQSWRERFLAQEFSAAEKTQLEQVFDAILPMLNGIIAAGMTISLAMAVLLARWWQARLFNPGGFGEEFQRLLLPQWITVITLLLMLMSTLPGTDAIPVLRGIMMVLVVVHVIQGIASVHRVVSVRRLSRNWLVAMYVFLLFLPQMGLILACIGMLDVWVRGRKSAPDDQV